MGYGMDQLSKKVASLVKKLAKLQREKIAYIKSSGGYMERRDDPFCSVQISFIHDSRICSADCHVPIEAFFGFLPVQSGSCQRDHDAETLRCVFHGACDSREEESRKTKSKGGQKNETIPAGNLRGADSQ